MELDVLYINNLIEALDKDKRDEGFGDIAWWNALPAQKKKELETLAPIQRFISDEKFSIKDIKNFRAWTEGKEVSQEAADLVFSSEKPVEMTFEEWKKSYKKAILKYNLRDEAVKIAANLSNEEHEVTDEEIEKAEQTLSSIFEESSTDGEEKDWTDASEISQVYSDMLDYRATHDKQYQFFNPTLDSMIEDGPEPGNGGVIASATGMGKTAFALNIFTGLITHRVPSLYLSLEMDKNAILDRMASILSLVPFRDLRNIRFSSNAAEIKFRVKKAFDALAKCDFKIYTGGSMSLKKLEVIVKKFKKTLPKDQSFVVFIDLLSMVDEFIEPKGGMNLASQIESAVNKLNYMAKKYGFHYIGLVQLNRTVEQDKVRNANDIEKLAPTRTSIKNSNALVERPRWALSLFRRRAYADLYLSPEEAETIPDEIEVNLLKLNNGLLQKKTMSFDGPTFKVSSIV